MKENTISIICDALNEVDEIRRSVSKKGVLPETLNITEKLLNKPFTLDSELQYDFRLIEPNEIRTAIELLDSNHNTHILDIQTDEEGFPLYYMAKVFEDEDSIIPMVVNEFHVSDGYRSLPSFISYGTKDRAYRLAGHLSLEGEIAQLTGARSRPDLGESVATLSSFPMWQNIDQITYEVLLGLNLDNTRNLMMMAHFLLGMNTGHKRWLLSNKESVLCGLEWCQLDLMSQWIEIEIDHLYNIRWDHLQSRALEVLPMLEMAQRGLYETPLASEASSSITVEGLVHGRSNSLDHTFDQLKSDNGVRKSMEHLESTGKQLKDYFLN
jgi:hypothetical protein